jgi:hypothetical protein
MIMKHQDLEKALDYVQSREFKGATAKEQEVIKNQLKLVPNNEFFQMFTSQYARELE